MRQHTKTRCERVIFWGRPAQHVVGSPDFWGIFVLLLYRPVSIGRWIGRFLQLHAQRSGIAGTVLQAVLGTSQPVTPCQNGTVEPKVTVISVDPTGRGPTG